VAGSALSLSACDRVAAVAKGQTAPTDAEPGGEEGDDEPTVAFVDPGGQFSFQRPQSWGQTTQPGEVVRYSGRDEFLSLIVVTTPAAPLEYGRTDAEGLAAKTPGYKGGALKSIRLNGRDAASLPYTWEAGPSQVTGKLVPSSANRYYIPGNGGQLAVFTYSGPTRVYDPAGADDFAKTFKWLK
jgi:hypothetical protein